MDIDEYILPGPRGALDNHIFDAGAPGSLAALQQARDKCRHRRARPSPPLKPLNSILKRPRPWTFSSDDPRAWVGRATPLEPSTLKEEFHYFVLDTVNPAATVKTPCASQFSDAQLHSPWLSSETVEKDPTNCALFESYLVKVDIEVNINDFIFSRSVKRFTTQ